MGPEGIKRIGKAIYGQTDEECAANAHLMAAGTELLELAGDLHDTLSDFMEDGRIKYEKGEKERLLKLMTASNTRFNKIEGV